MCLRYWLRIYGGVSKKQISEEGKNIYVGEEKTKWKQSLVLVNHLQICQLTHYFLCQNKTQQSKRQQKQNDLVVNLQQMK